jgi:YfiH family protein
MRTFSFSADSHEPVAWFPLGSGRDRGPRAALSLRSAGDLGAPQRHADRGQESRAHACARRREDFLRQLGFEPSRLRSCRQVHSQAVLWADGLDAAELAAREADGLLACGRELLLAVTVADCLPIYLADRDSGAFGILHSGWRGTGILERAVRIVLSRSGGSPRSLSVTLGPCIGSCCYSVDRERYLLFRERYGPGCARRGSGGEGYALDLQQANLEILKRLGVTDVAVVGSCTACTPELSSFRRDGPSFAHMLAFIGFPPQAAERRGS